MNSLLKGLSLTFVLLFAPFSFAEGDLSRANIITLKLEMGSNAKGMYFLPNELNLVTGQAYKLQLVNSDAIKHELEAFEFIEKIFTRKVEIHSDTGALLAEIKGNITEIEVGPHATVDWYFVPVQTGENIDMVCALAGHKEAGMLGLINIK